MTIFPTNNDEIIKNINYFCNETIKNYSSKRNFVLGSPHINVSKLSPYIRRRLISEEQILKKIIKNKSDFKIDKFVIQLFWRTYFRGWLETHPWVYEQYEKENKSYNIPSKTGIKCFDSWTEELIETGYLHNHARMWYASIWIFTLNKSWQSGAYFFENNLLDWCPASNTLGWRWVAGLHTINKHYVATENNINFFTNFEFKPQKQINEKVIPIKYDFLNNEALIFSYKETKLSNVLQNIGIILNNNDLSLNLVLDDLNLSYDACVFKNSEKKIYKNNLIIKFEESIFNDVIKRNINFSIKEDFESLLKWVQIKKIKNLVVPYETVGNTILKNSAFLKKINENKIKIIFYLRKWDEKAFPFAQKGFFKFKKKIPSLLELNGFL
ncbi:FAD-binding domain-containing protein [Alphaproteobacteria bacterium]|nr:FAD-binding domain-containing protein [Alphaproteobacteria bacterium]